MPFFPPYGKASFSAARLPRPGRKAGAWRAPSSAGEACPRMANAIAPMSGADPNSKRIHMTPRSRARWDAEAPRHFPAGAELGIKSMESEARGAKAAAAAGRQNKNCLPRHAQHYGRQGNDMLSLDEFRLLKAQ